MRCLLELEAAKQPALLERLLPRSTGGYISADRAVVLLQALGPLLGPAVAAYAALMHCQRPHRFEPPADDGQGDGAPGPHGLPLLAVAKRAHRFAKEQLAHLASVFGLHGVPALCSAAAPTLLAAAKPAEVAHSMHGMHALDGLVATEAASMMQAIERTVRSPHLACVSL